MDPDPKRALRRVMRQVRRDLDDQPARSAAIARHLADLPEVAAASVVMLFDAVQGEPDLAPLATALAGVGTHVVRPDPSPAAPFPVDPVTVDVVVVPGVAFTAEGHRLGQGGGWYDRFLAEAREDALVVGVCFAVQVVDDIAVEPHDVAVDVVVHEGGIAATRATA